MRNDRDHGWSPRRAATTSAATPMTSSSIQMFVVDEATTARPIAQPHQATGWRSRAARSSTGSGRSGQAHGCCLRRTTATPRQRPGARRPRRERPTPAGRRRQWPPRGRPGRRASAARLGLLVRGRLRRGSMVGSDAVSGDEGVFDRLRLLGLRSVAESARWSAPREWRSGSRSPSGIGRRGRWSARFLVGVGVASGAPARRSGADVAGEPSQTIATYPPAGTVSEPAPSEEELHSPDSPSDHHRPQ